MTGPGQTPKLLEQMRAILRVRRYALRTEQAYCDWVRRYVKFHRMRSQDDLAGGKEKVESFLTDLAVRGQVASSTQNQALNALLFLYEQVLEQPLQGAGRSAQSACCVMGNLTADERRFFTVLSYAAKAMVLLSTGCNSYRVEIPFVASPRVAPSSQPWAECWNPFRIQLSRSATN